MYVGRSFTVSNRSSIQLTATHIELFPLLPLIAVVTQILFSLFLSGPGLGSTWRQLVCRSQRTTTSRLIT